MKGIWEVENKKKPELIKCAYCNKELTLKDSIYSDQDFNVFCNKLCAMGFHKEITE